MKPSYFSTTRFLILIIQGIQIVVLLALAGFAGWGVHQMGRVEDREFYESIPLIKGASYLESAADHEVMALRNSLLTGQVQSPSTVVNLLGHYNYALKWLDANLPDPKSKARLKEIRSRGEAYRAVETEVFLLQKLGRSADATARFNETGPTVIEPWLRDIERFVITEQTAAEIFHTEDNEVEFEVKFWLGFACAVELPLGLALAWLLARRVVTPLRELEQASQALAAGRFDGRVPMGRPDEFGQVAMAFNSMATQVESSMTALNVANQELVQLDRTKDEFLSIASHELKTPLSAIKGFTSLLGNQYASGMNALQLQYTENIALAADRLIRLVGNLLDVATIRLGKFSLDRHAHNYGLLVEDVLETLQPMAQEFGVSLAAEFASRPVLSVDYDRVTQILTNLIANALKFTPAGGQVTVQVAMRDGGLLTEVRDTGVGIAEEDVSKLFRPFSQLDMGSARRAGGTGLGLSISKALVEAHGGKIGLRSQPGSGSTFWFWLPVS